MNDHGHSVEDRNTGGQPSSPVEQNMSLENSPEPTPSATGDTESMEERLKRLEAALAAVEDSRQVEDRVVQRVREEMDSKFAKAKAEESITEKKQSKAFMKGLFRAGGASEQEAAAAAALAAAAPKVMKEAWFWVDVWKELRAIVRMFFDVNYHIAWWVRFLVIGVLVLILFSHYWIYPFMITTFGVGQLFDKMFTLVMSFVMYKALSREARRYMLVQEGKTKMAQEPPPGKEK